MTPDEVIADNLRRIREEAGLSPGELADRLPGVSRTTIYDYERPRQGRKAHRFTWTELLALSRALECSISELVKGSSGDVEEMLGGEYQALRREAAREAEKAIKEALGELGWKETE
jgi:transcriptional regulator with XRE-family HTH domain